MKWKKFLKPDWRKIVLFILVFIFFSFINIFFSFMIICYDCPTVYGFPLPYYWYGGFCPPTGCPVVFKPFFLFFDLILYYLLSCLIVWIYDKVKKK